MRLLGRTALVLALATGLAAGTASAQANPPAAGGAAKPAAAAKPKKARAAKPKKANITEACGTDAAIYCDDDEKGGVSKAACLRANKSLVSPECAAAL